MAVRLHHDYETYSDVDLKKRGLDVYSADRSTEVLMCSYAFNDEPVQLWYADDGPMPAELREALEDPEVEKHGFNAQFERVIATRCLGLKVGYKNWRCTQVLSYMHSFFGGLAQVGSQVGLDDAHLKDPEGARLMRMFSMPQKPTKRQPLTRFNSWTHPEEFQRYGEYCRRDTLSERSIYRRLRKFYYPALEWDLYEIDQQINDAGIPIDMDFVLNAKAMAARRKAELTETLVELTGLRNPNSPSQLTAWLRERGYPFSDLRKDTVKKVLAENADVARAALEIHDEEFTDAEVSDAGFITEDCWRALLLRQQVARTSVKKYDAIERLVGSDGYLRFGFQFHGASRTGRDAGRGLNPQNLTRTPGDLEVTKEAKAAGVPEDAILECVTDLIRQGDYEGLCLTVKEPMNALAGTVRSAVRAPKKHELVAADLASIETCVIGWVSGCDRLLNVFRNGLDAYKDFATELYGVPYEDVTKKQRTDSKPGVLGCGFRLGGGELRDGKRTSLWGYAEGMGINLTKEGSHKAVKIFRTTYPEIPKLWYALEKAAEEAMRTGRKVRPIIRHEGRVFEVPVTFQIEKPYLVIWLPSGRPLRYYKPRYETKIMRGAPTPEHPDGEPYEKRNLTYLGKAQNGNKWMRIFTHGGKLTENIVQAIARDILFIGLKRAFETGFKICLRVHDELVAVVKTGSNFYTGQLLADLMTEVIDWCPDIPLGAAFWQALFYRKD